MNKRFNKESQAEAEILYENMLDDKLFNFMEVLEYPSKWKVDVDGITLIDVYPHPVFDKSYNVKKVIYKPYKYQIKAQLPKPLLERHTKLMMDIELASNPNGRGKYKKTRKKHVRVTEDMKKEMIRLYQAGINSKDIASYMGVSDTTAKLYINEHKKEVQV